MKEVCNMKNNSVNEDFIFISYSHKDSEIVLKVIESLQRKGYRVWYDEGIDPGTEWDKNIADHVEACGYFIAFVSKNYISSSNCKDELNFARDLEKRRFLVYIEEVDLPSEMKMRLSRIQNIHKYKYDSEQDFYDKLFCADGLEEFREDSFDKLTVNQNEKDFLDKFKTNKVNCKNLVQVMKVEDCFSIAGRGVVLIGFVQNCELHVNDKVVIRDRECIISAIEQNGKILRYAAGERVGLLIKNLSDFNVNKGDCLYKRV